MHEPVGPGVLVMGGARFARVLSLLGRSGAQPVLLTPPVCLLSSFEHFWAEVTMRVVVHLLSLPSLLCLGLLVPSRAVMQRQLGRRSRHTPIVQAVERCRLCSVHLPVLHRTVVQGQYDQ